MDRIIKRVYKNSDNILVSSQRFAETIAQYIDDKLIGYAPNWLIEEPQQASSVRPDTQKFNFTFTGNILKIQTLDNVVLGWQKAGLQNNATLNIVGDGSSLNRLKELIAQEKIEGMVLHGRQPSAQILDILNQSNVLVMPLVSDPGIMKTEPYKLQSYLMAGKPIFGVIDGVGREIIEEHHWGLCADPTDIAKIAVQFGAMIDFAINNRDNVAIESEVLRAHRYNSLEIIDRIVAVIEHD